MGTTLTGFIINAETPKEAMDLAESAAEDIVDKGCSFDFYRENEIPPKETNMEFSDVCGYPAVMLASSKKAQEFMDEQMGMMRSDDLRDMQCIRDHVNALSNEDILEGIRLPNTRDFSMACWGLSTYVGHRVLLYDQNGDGIRTPSSLKDALDNAKNDDYEAWLVLISFHS